MTLSRKLVTALVFAGTLGRVNCAAPLRAAAPEEVLRIVSPDSIVDAVVTRNSEGATTSNVFRIFLVRHAEPVPREAGRELFRADRVNSVCIAWTSPQLLEVRYQQARIFHFSNFWNSGEVQRFEYVVELRLNALHPVSSLADPAPEQNGIPGCAQEING